MKKLLLIVFIAVSVIACKDVINDIPDTPLSGTSYTFDYNANVLPPTRIPSDNKLTVAGVQLGRMLFYDPILSGDSTQSCASCHNQANAFTDNNKALSEGIDGSIGTRNSMPVFNLMWHLDGFFWDGRADLLRHQALMPIQDPVEMNETLGNMLVKLNRSPMYQKHFKEVFNTEKTDEVMVSKALEQFMMSIVSSNSKFDRVAMGMDTFTTQEKHGQIIFNSEAIVLADERDPNNPKNIGADCFHCHGNSLFMRREYLNNGLPYTGDKGRGGVTKDAEDDCKFKTPSLRNIEKTAPYMHDGRFTTLEEVVQFYLGPMENNCQNLAGSPNLHALKDSIYLSEEHKASLVSFLKTLTDESLLTDERYSDPFK